MSSMDEFPLAVRKAGRRRQSAKEKQHAAQVSREVIELDRTKSRLCQTYGFSLLESFPYQSRLCQRGEQRGEQRVQRRKSCVRTVPVCVRLGMCASVCVCVCVCVCVPVICTVE